MTIQNTKARAAIALVEALLVFLILIVVVGIIIAALQTAREGHWRTVNANNLKTLANAVQLAHQQNKTFPPIKGAYGGKPAVTGYTFHFHILPFVESSSLWSSFVPGPVVTEFIGPNDPTQTGQGAGAGNYAVNFRLFCVDGGTGVLGTDNNVVKLKLADITDGPANTILFATKYMNCGSTGGSYWASEHTTGKGAYFGDQFTMFQAAPAPADCQSIPANGAAQSFTSDAIQVALCDGSVRSVAVGISQQTWTSALTYAGKDTLGSDWPE